MLANALRCGRHNHQFCRRAAGRGDCFTCNLNLDSHADDEASCAFGNWSNWPGHSAKRPECHCWLAQQCNAQRDVFGHPSHSGSTDHAGLVNRQSAPRVPSLLRSSHPVQVFPSEPRLLIEHPADTAGQASSGTHLDKRTPQTVPPCRTPSTLHRAWRTTTR
jgi:hypothetical protein